MLDDSFTFLNHGAFGGTLRGCLTSKREWSEYMERQPVRFVDRELFPHLVNVTRGMAQVLQARSQDIMPMPSATVGMNTVLRSWQRKFKPSSKDRVLILSVAYGSTKKILAKLAQESGFQIDEAKVTLPLDSEDTVLKALDAALTPETTLVVLDVVPSNAPFVLPAEEAVRLCRRRAPGAFILADAAHGLFSLPMKLSGPGSIGADALVTNCHKWFCGPKGTAVLYVSQECQSWIDPLIISHGIGTDFASGFYWPGLADFSSWLALDEALSFWDLIGLESARLYGHYLVMDAAERLVDAWGTELGFPMELIGPMALVRLPQIPALPRGEDGYKYEEAERIQNYLFQRNVEVPIKALSGELYVRLSAHIYNYSEEYEVLRDAILELQKCKEF